jgi:hypothetical protein
MVSAHFFDPSVLTTDGLQKQKGHPERSANGGSRRVVCFTRKGDSMLKRHALYFVLIALITACCSNKAPENVFSTDELNDGPVVVEVDGVKIHQGFLDVLSRFNPRIKTDLANPLARTKLLNSIVDQQLLYKEALSRGLENNDDVGLRILLTQHSLISNALVEDELKAAMQKAYEEQKNDKFTKLTVSLIAANFVPDVKNDPKNKSPKDRRKEKDTPATAAQKQAALDRIKKIKDRLSKGEDFVKVATAESDDKMTAKKGGDAGQISKDDSRFSRLGLKDVVTAAFTLKKDEVSNPIETTKGYYLVKVTSDPVQTPFEEAERVLRFELQSKIKEQILGDLRKKAKIEFVGVKDEPKKDTGTEPKQIPTDTQTGPAPNTVTPQKNAETPDAQKTK